ncbi:MAG: energy transducer TonB [Candidatus Omnitrophica bacterium]|nr:energy transducer TonB [Candidatus Omnitrophota bacterium]
MTKKIIIYLAVFSISVFSMVPVAPAQYEDQVELISLDLKGMEIRDVLKILSQKSGLNIVADNDVKGTVSLYVKDVDVMDALDIVVFTNGLAYEQEGTLIRIMTDKKYEKLHGAMFKDRAKTEIVKLEHANATSIAAVLSKIKTRAGKVIADDASNTIVLIDNAENVKRMKEVIEEMDVLLVTEVFSLGYANAEAIKDKLEKMLSENIGSIKFDDRTNKLVVKDTPSKMKEIKKIIEAFDEKTREVMIDAHIIKVTLSDKYSSGIDWSTVATLGDITIESASNLTTSLTGTTPSTFTIAKKGGTHSSVLRLLKTFGETDVLSRPRITVTNNEEANILVGAKEVYVTSEVTTTSGGTYHTTDHVQFVDVGVRLSVTPEINKDGYIKMKIKPEVSDTDSTKTVTLTNPDGSTRAIIPYVTTSEAETTVLVKDNTTIIVGGLMKDTITKYNEKVPFLSDIPILGKLFTSKGKSKEKTELVIFLTPHIIEGDVVTEDARSYVDKWEEKAKELEIEEPREPEFKLPQLFGKKTSKSVSPRALKTKPASKWTKLGYGLREDKVSTRDKRSISEKTSYEEYYLIVREEISNIAKGQDVSGAVGNVELQFTLDNEGFLARSPVVLNKPDLALVRAAVSCVKKAVPFPPFPKSLRKVEAEFRVTVKYE